MSWLGGMRPTPALDYAVGVDVRAGRIDAFYLFDVAESADLALIPALVGGEAVPARLAPKPATPAYVQYEKPPLSFDGEVVGVGEFHELRCRIRVYDYGVVSVALQRPFSGEWPALFALGQQLIEDAELEHHAERVCRIVMDRLGAALQGARREFLSEDYVVVTVHEIGVLLTADDLLAARGTDIAAMLRGERHPLSDQEKTKVLEHRISYLADDLVIPTWNAAFVYDTPAGAQAALEILEYANSQLLEYRHYDQLLDNKLAAIYAQLQHPRWYDQWLGSRYTRAAREVQSLLIDVNELTDRTENAIKFVGDLYAVRLFGLVADRLALPKWKSEVEAKLETLDDIYRFAVEQSSMARGQFLESTIVLILVLELLLILMGVMRP
jgi:hypothetical protein